MTIKPNEKNENGEINLMNILERYALLPEQYLKMEIRNIEYLLCHFLNSKKIQKQDSNILLSLLKPIHAFLNKTICQKKEEIIKDFKKQRLKHNVKRRLYKEAHAASFLNTQQPLPITGEINIAGLNETLLKIHNQQKDNKYKFPFKIPQGTHWHSIIIKFLNDEDVEIWMNKTKHITNFKEMGMVGKGKIQTPSTQWTFLKVLSQNNGELTIKDHDAKQVYRKQKQLLCENLQKYFSIDYDPFYPYFSSTEKSGNSYKIKLTLIPPPKQLDFIPIERNKSDNLGIEEFLKEEAPLLP